MRVTFKVNSAVAHVGATIGILDDYQFSVRASLLSTFGRRESRRSRWFPPSWARRSCNGF